MRTSEFLEIVVGEILIGICTESFVSDKDALHDLRIWTSITAYYSIIIFKYYLSAFDQEHAVRAYIAFDDEVDILRHDSERRIS